MDSVDRDSAPDTFSAMALLGHTSGNGGNGNEDLDDDDDDAINESVERWRREENMLVEDEDG